MALPECLFFFDPLLHHHGVRRGLRSRGDVKGRAATAHPFVPLFTRPLRCPSRPATATGGHHPQAVEVKRRFNLLFSRLSSWSSSLLLNFYKGSSSPCKSARERGAPPHRHTVSHRSRNSTRGPPPLIQLHKGVWYAPTLSFLEPGAPQFLKGSPSPNKFSRVCGTPPPHAPRSPALRQSFGGPLPPFNLTRVCGTPPP